MLDLFQHFKTSLLHPHMIFFFLRGFSRDLAAELLRCTFSSLRNFLCNLAADQ
jgi:hypothetical protein